MTFFPDGAVRILTLANASEGDPVLLLVGAGRSTSRSPPLRLAACGNAEDVATRPVLDEVLTCAYAEVSRVGWQSGSLSNYESIALDTSIQGSVYVRSHRVIIVMD